MEDNVPDILEFETLHVHESSNKTENILKLEDPPIAEHSHSPSDTSDTENPVETNDEQEFNNEDLLNLNEPPEEEDTKEIRESANNLLTDDVISQFAQNLVDPIVKEAIEIQKAEMEDSLSDEIKIDSSGDKKSEKSLSDDGFEYVKADEINSSSQLDQHSEEMHHMLDSESYNKDTEDDSFLNDDLKIEDNDDTFESTSIMMKEHDEDSFVTEDLKIDDNALLYSMPSLQKEPIDDSFLPEDLNIEDSIYPSHQIADRSERFSDNNEDESAEIGVSSSFADNFENDKSYEEIKEEDYVFDIQGIINASNLNPIKSESPPLHEESLHHISSDDDASRSDSRKINNISGKLKDIFCWKNPILSSIILSAIMLIEFGLMCDYSIISLLAYSGLLLLCSSFCYKFALKFNLLKKCDQSECTISVSSDDIQLCVDCVLKWIEHLFNEIRSLTYVTSFTKNLKAFTFFWILTYIGQWFNLLSLIFLGTITSFSLPIIYITYKDTIDQVTNNVRERVKESIDKVKLKSQKLIKCRAR